MSECGGLSARGKCQRCAIERQRANIAQLRNHTGEFFTFWRRQHAAAVGGVLLDDLIERS